MLSFSELASPCPTMQRNAPLTRVRYAGMGSTRLLEMFYAEHACGAGHVPLPLSGQREEQQAMVLWHTCVALNDTCPCDANRLIRTECLP